MKNAIPFLIISIFISCSQRVTTNYSDDFSVPDYGVNGNEAYLNLNSDYIFDQNILHEFQLIIPKISYKMINDDPTKEEYIEGALIF